MCSVHHSSKLCCGSGRETDTKIVGGDIHRKREIWFSVVVRGVSARKIDLGGQVFKNT